MVYALALLLGLLTVLIEYQTRPEVIERRSARRRVARHSAWLAERSRNNPGRRWS